MPNHAPFVFWGVEPLKIVGSYPNPQKAHPWVTTRPLSHKWLKSVQRCDLVHCQRRIEHSGCSYGRLEAEHVN